MMKYYTAEKKKKSVSLYEGRKDSEMLIRHAYEGHKNWSFSIICL